MVATILAVWRAKEFQDVLGVFVWLCSINTAFWLLARAAGALVHLMGEIMWEWLWGLLATVYNVALAVLFAAIVFISANRVTQIGSPLGRQMCGFVLLYLALSAAYMDSEASEINEYARPGFFAGLASYVLFAAFPALVAFPKLVALYDVLKTVAQSWVGWALSAYGSATLAWRLFHQGLAKMFYHLSPMMWFAGMLKHPPIRVRRRDD